MQANFLYLLFISCSSCVNTFVCYLSFTDPEYRDNFVDHYIKLNHGPGLLVMEDSDIVQPNEVQAKVEVQANETKPLSGGKQTL